MPYPSACTQGASVAADAFDGEGVAGGRGDGVDDAKRNAFALEQWPLLDVEFDPGVVVILGQTHAGELPGEAGGGPDPRLQLGQELGGERLHLGL